MRVYIPYHDIYIPYRKSIKILSPTSSGKEEHMGYYASGYGSFTLKTDADRSKALEAIVGLWDVALSGDEIEYRYDGKYYSDEVLDVLYKIAPFIIEGSEMYFSGEDDCHWRFVFENGEWVEENGEVIYGDEFERMRWLLTKAVRWIREEEQDDEKFRNVLDYLGFLEAEIKELAA